VTNPKSPKYKFKKAWSWPTEIEAKIKSLCEGFTLHVCSGDSTIGDVRLDLHKDVRLDLHKGADIRGDMFHLPFRPMSFDTVLCDPPWHLPYHLRGKLLRQLRDVLKAGGRLIFNCFWFPKTRGLDVDKEIFVGVPNNLWRNASLLITARRMALGNAINEPATL
jgi:SAM-dependent methyltransferase